MNPSLRRPRDLHLVKLHSTGADEILETKLVPSFISGPLLRRNRLFAELAWNVDAKLFLVHGAAGSGKSSLLYDYLRSRGAEAAWYSLDKSDRDAKVFLLYLLASVRRRHPDPARGVFERVTAAESIVVEWKSILTPFINNLHRYGKEILVALDDYHVLDGSELAAEIMEFLLLHSPPNVRFFIATRTFPDLPLAYLKSKNALVAIRPDDLRLDERETRDLFNAVWSFSLSDRALEAISAKTEGWFAAARLIAQAIKNRSAEEAEQYLERLDMKGGLIYDYLAHEVYLKQTAEIRNFLKRTCILKSFNRELSEFVSGLPGTRETLEELEKIDLFVIHLDNRREWWRYHHLFSEYLQSLLAREDPPEELCFLHHRAALWYEKHHLHAEAVEHWLEAKEYDAAARLIEKEGPALFQKGLLASLSRWIAALPHERKGSSHHLLVLEGQVHDAMGSWEKAVASYEHALGLLKAEKASRETPLVLEKLVLCLIKYGEYSRIFEHCDRALALCGEEDKGLRARLLSWLGMAHVVYGSAQWEKGYELLKEGYLLAYASGDPEAIASACVSYGFMYHFPQGNFSEAQGIFNQGSLLLERMGFRFLACHQTMNKAVVQIFDANHPEAAKTIGEVAETLDEYAVQFINQALHVTRLMLNLQQKNLPEAKRILSLVVEQEIPMQIRPWYYRSVALLRLLEKNIEQGFVAGEEMMNQLRHIGNGMYAPECYLTMGLLYWRKHLPHGARKWFEKALATAERGKMKFWIMKAHYCLAAFFAGLRNAPFEFKSHYTMAAKLTGENNYYSFWSADPFDLGAPVLMEAFRMGVEPEETKKIIASAKERILRKTGYVLRKGSVQARILACKILEALDDPDALALLRKVKSSHNKRIRKRAHEAMASLRVSSPRLRIATLGAFSLSRENHVVRNSEWRRPRSLKLFKYFLAMYPREVIPEQLIETFWPDLPLREARHNLAVNLSVVRKVLNPSGPRRDDTFIEAAGEILSLKLGEDDRFDAEDFRSFCQKGNAHWKHQRWEAAAACFRKATDLYRGDFLEGDLYEAWTEQRREDLLGDYLAALERLGAYCEKQRQPAEAVAWYQAYLRKHPLNETIFQALTRCLGAMGDFASVRKEYARFKALLWDQSAQTPSPLTRASVAELLERG